MRISITRMQAFRIIKNASHYAKIDSIPSPHWFRHSSATHAIENGAPIHVVQHSLGHSLINTTSKYLHASPRDLSQWPTVDSQSITSLVGLKKTVQPQGLIGHLK